MKVLHLLLIIFFSLTFAQAQETFPISPIGTQHVFPGSKVTTTFSAVNQDLPSISLSSPDLPDFANFEDKGKGFGLFTFEPTEANVGTHLINVRAISGADTSSTQFQVVIPTLPATLFYADPVNGNNSNPGTSSAPWKTLAEVFQTGKSIPDGAVIFLRSGNHGDPVVNQLKTSTTYILAEKGATPMFEKLNFFSAKNWLLSGVKITPEAVNTSAKGNYVRIQPNCSNITIENCEIYGTSDVMNWMTNQDWYDNAGDGILIEGESNLIRNNYIYNIYFGLTAKGNGHIVSHNLLDNYGADGFRGLGNYCKYLYNRIQNALVDDYATGNHDDGFQSWASNGSVKNVTLKGNQIFSHTDPSLPLKTSILQGLVNFDGYSENWVIEDNLVLTDHPHGITLLGAKNCKVVNNTVLNNPLNLFSYGNPPWIRIGPLKNSAKSTGNLNRNNLMAFNYEENDPGTFDHNIIAKYQDHFANYAHWNFHLKKDSAPINGGIKEDGSTFDNAQHIRLDSFPDVGCYEFNSNTFDYTSPTIVTISVIKNLTPTSAEIYWSASQDQYGIKRYHITFDNQHITTDSLEAILLGLKVGSEQVIDIWAEDFAGHFSNPIMLQFTTNPYPEDTIKITIPVSPADQLIQNTKEQRWAGLYKHTVGGYTFVWDASAVLPFKLPVIPNGYTIDQAKLVVNLERVANNPIGSADLYSLGIRSLPFAFSEDHWQGAYGTQTLGTEIQKAFLNKNIPLGNTETSKTASKTLASFLNSQENSTFKHLILRINSDQENESNYRFYEFSSGNHPNTFWRPSLELVLTKVLSLDHIPNQSISVFPNPIKKSDDLTITWDNQKLSGNLTISIHDMTGKLIQQYHQHASLNQLTIPTALLSKEGIYILTINDLDTYLSTQISISK